MKFINPFEGEGKADFVNPFESPKEAPQSFMGHVSDAAGAINVGLQKVGEATGIESLEAGGGGGTWNRARPTLKHAENSQTLKFVRKRKKLN